MSWPEMHSEFYSKSFALSIQFPASMDDNIGRWIMASQTEKLKTLNKNIS